jgi:hypothetical protein
VNLNEVTQRRLERYQESLIDLGAGVKSAAAYNRIIIEAAVGAGIADGVPADLGDLPPRSVTALTKRILEHVNKALEPLSGEA